MVEPISVEPVETVKVEVEEDLWCDAGPVPTVPVPMPARIVSWGRWYAVATITATVAALATPAAAGVAKARAVVTAAVRTGRFIGVTPSQSIRRHRMLNTSSLISIRFSLVTMA